MLRRREKNLLPIQVIQAGLDVGVVIVHLVLVEGRFGLECHQRLLKLDKLSLPPLSVASLVANILRVTGLFWYAQKDKTEQLMIEFGNGEALAYL